MSELISTVINGQKFAVVDAENDPKSAYVEHQGALYPANHGYPLRVLVDQVAEPSQLVLVPHEHGCIAALAHTSRIAFIKREEDDLESYHQALLRMHLASSAFMPIALGDVGVPCEIRDPAHISLPAVVHPRKTLLALAGVVAFLACTSLGAYLAEHYLAKAAAEAGAEGGSVLQQMEVARTRLAELKAQVHPQAEAPVQSAGSLSMPEPIQSFAETIMAFSPDVTFKVIHGQIQTTGSR